MSSPVQQPEIYNAEWATHYERRANAAIAGRDGLYRLCVAALAKIPSPQNVLVVGCGTGEELDALARTLPAARFDGVDPSPAMLEFCHQRLARQSMHGRVSLHASTLSGFAATRRYQGVTSILVAQHLPDLEAAAFFRQIFALLEPGGVLYTADLHIPAGQDRQETLALWRTQAELAGSEPELLDGMLQRFATDIRPRDEAEIRDLLAAAGFHRVLKAFSSTIYGAWVVTRPT